MIGKKGSMIDMFFFLFVFLLLGMVFLISSYTYDQVSAPMMAWMNQSSDDKTAMIMIRTTRADMAIFDYIFAFLWLALSIIPIYMSTQVQNHPIYFVINIILFLIYMVIVPTISNSMLELWSQPALSQYSAGGSAYVTFPIMTRIFQYMPLLSFGIAFILSIAMFGKSGGGGI